MAKGWDYSELSKAAKAAGGPEKLMEKLVSESKAAGRAEMLPVVGAAVLLTAATVKVVDYFKEKRQRNETELEQAKQELIDGIKRYDEEHKDDEEE